MNVGCPRCDRDHPRGSPECHGRRVGKVFAGKYRVLRVLGAGGMGVVFEVEHVKLGRRSALKLLLRRGSGRVAMERFKREAQRLAELKSPGIVEVYDAGHDEDDTPYLEMELLTGTSLEDALSAGPLAPARAAEIVRAALAGLEVAHDAGVVHRDLKPDNVFLVGDARTSTEVKLLDFGIAKSAEDEGLTREGAVLGTAYFMSPEQAKSSVGADARSDVYAMGATLYRALTGAYPVEPGPTVAVVAKIVTGRVSRHPREIVAAVPAWLDAIVARAMAHQPADRYPSARAMREALESALTPASTEADDEAPSGPHPPAPAPAVTEQETAPAESVAPAARAHVPPAPVIPNRDVRANAVEPPAAAAEARSLWPRVAVAAVLLAGLGGAAALLGRKTEQSPGAPGATSAPAGPSTSLASVPASSSTSVVRAAPLPGMVAFPGGAVAIGTPEAEQATALARCKTTLAIDPRDCTAPRLAREAARSAEVAPFDLDTLEVDNATFTAWVAGEIAAGKATVDAKGVVQADGAPVVQTGSQHAGIDAAAGTLKLRAGFEKRPVVMVSWAGATRFCAAQGKRLPTETEWEAAARDGRHPDFPWGSDVPTCEDVAFGGSAQKRCSIASARDVGASPGDVTRSGVRDLGGNVMEWVEGKGDVSDARPMRGGSWAGSAFEARTARRRFGKITEMLNDVGFRCARDPAR